MARYHQIDVEAWEDLVQFESPGPKLVFVYLFSNAACRPSGLYKILPQTIHYHTGTTLEDLKALCGKFIEYDFETNEVFVRGKFKRVLSGFKNNEKMRSAILADYKGLRSPLLSSLFFNKYKEALKGLCDPPLHLHLHLPKKEEEREKEEKKVIVAKPDSILESDLNFDRRGAYERFFESYPHPPGMKAKSPLGDYKAASLFMQSVVNQVLEFRILIALENYRARIGEGRAETLFEWLKVWPDFENPEDEIEDRKTEESVT